MAYAVASLVQRVRQLVNDTPWETTVGEALDASETEVDLGSTATYEDFAEGDVIEVDSEEMYVYSSTDAATDTITVKRGHNNTTAATHSSGAVLIKNPTFSYSKVIGAIDSTITSQWPYTWKKSTDTITPVTGTVWYDLDATFMDPIRVQQLRGPSGTSIGYFGAKRSYKPVQFSRDLPASLAASGVGVRFPGGLFDSSNTVTVLYRAKLTTTLATTNYSDINDGVLADLVAWGSAARLVAGRSAPRVTGSDNSMYDQSIDPQSIQYAGDYYERKYRELRSQYHEELLLTSRPMFKWAK